MTDAALIRKSIPILDERIKALFREVEGTTKRLCKNSKGTELAEFGVSTYKTTKGLGQVDSPIAARRYFEDIIPVLEAHCELFPLQIQNYFKNLVCSMETASLEKRFEVLKSILETILFKITSDQQYKDIIDLLKSVEFNTSKLSLSSGSIRQDLFSLQADIKNLQGKIDSHGQTLEELGSILEQRGSQEIERLDMMRNDLLQSIEPFAQNNVNKQKANEIHEEIQEMKKKIEEMKRSKIIDAASILSDIITIGSYLNLIRLGM